LTSTCGPYSPSSSAGGGSLLSFWRDTIASQAPTARWLALCKKSEPQSTVDAKARLGVNGREGARTERREAVLVRRGMQASQAWHLANNVSPPPSKWLFGAQERSLSLAKERLLRKLTSVNLRSSVLSFVSYKMGGRARRGATGRSCILFPLRCYAALIRSTGQLARHWP